MMDKIRSKLTNKILGKITSIYFIYIRRDKFYRAHKKWVYDRGDQNLRYTYNLDSDSIVFDLGGYRGDFASKIYEKYGSKIYIFEPVDEYFKHIDKRFLGNKNIKVYNFGLSSVNKKTNISLNDNGSSVYGASSSSELEPIELRNISDFITENDIRKIDLMKINIEGGEFDVLPELIKTDQINMVTNLQVQFHKFVDQAKLKRREIRKQLRSTHKLTFDYYFIWENWQKK